MVCCYYSYRKELGRYSASKMKDGFDSYYTSYLNAHEFQEYIYKNNKPGSTNYPFYSTMIDSYMEEKENYVNMLHNHIHCDDNLQTPEDFLEILTHKVPFDGWLETCCDTLNRLAKKHKRILSITISSHTISITCDDDLVQNNPNYGPNHWTYFVLWNDIKN